MVKVYSKGALFYTRIHYSCICDCKTSKTLMKRLPIVDADDQLRIRQNLSRLFCEVFETHRRFHEAFYDGKNVIFLAFSSLQAPSHTIRSLKLRHTKKKHLPKETFPRLISPHNDNEMSVY